MSTTFGERLRVRRLSLDISRPALAAQADVSESTVCRWELGGATPTAEKLGNLADALGCTADFLLGRDEADQ